MKTVCETCPRRCALEEGSRGFCRARENRGGRVVCANYGKLTGLSLDPVEKKPLRRFHPGSLILSAGSYGCNLRCPFCQNHAVSMAGETGTETAAVTPETLVLRALALVPRGNIGLAYTYNEPLVGWEFVRDCAALARKKGLLNVAVTNGYINETVLEALLPFLDAMNIDLKGFTERFYEKIGGRLETVRRSIALSAQRCHVEVTTLIIPGENDSPEEMDALSRWLASVSPDISLHVARFFPRYRMAGRAPTPVETVYSLAERARKNLRHVYEGNC